MCACVHAHAHAHAHAHICTSTSTYEDKMAASGRVLRWEYVALEFPSLGM